MKYILLLPLLAISCRPAPKPVMMEDSAVSEIIASKPVKIGSVAKPVDHHIPKKGMAYVHYWNHSDSLIKIIYDSAGNYKKGFEKGGYDILKQSVRLDEIDDSIYRVKYHFIDYYYMWGYNANGHDAWGENIVTLSRRPTESEIRAIVWNEFFKGERGFDKLVIMDISASSSNANALQNQDPITKATIGYHLKSN